MENLPLVCVCIPCYNAEKTIVETLESIQKQTYSNVEIYIFDNASTDNTVKLVADFDTSIHIYKSEKTTTGEENFTRCLNLGRGDYTAIYHADDLYAPEMIEKEVAFLEKDKALGVLTFANIINEHSQKVKSVYAPVCLGLDKGESRAFEIDELFSAVLRNNNFFFCPSAMIRTQVCINVLKEWRGKLFGPGADLDVWFRIAKEGGLGLINQPLLQYRVSSSHFSHHYNKQNTDRAVLFTILNYWIDQEDLSLDRLDKHWYDTWLMRDNVVRARNAIAQKNIGLAIDLLAQVQLITMFKEALKSWRGMKFFLLAVNVKIKLMFS